MACHMNTYLLDDALVGAGASPGGSGTQRSRLSFSNYGSTVDLQGWGENVWTTGYGSAYSADGANYNYTSSFNGTSSASPIVAGACILLQSAQKGKTGNVLSPEDVKQILRATGSVQLGNTAENIGPMPNAVTAISSILPTDSAGSFRIHNDGNVPLTVSSLGLDQSASWISWSAQTPFNVPPNSYRTVTVFVDYSQAPSGQSVRHIVVHSNDPNKDPYPGDVTITVNTPSYTISASAGSGGIMSPSGSFTKNASETQTFTAFPYANYEVNQWLVDGAVVQTGGSYYTLSNIQTSHSVQVTFAFIASTDANLSSLSLSNGMLTPEFSTANTSYTASVSSVTDSITLTPTASNVNASIVVRVNSGIFSSVASGSASSSLALNVGNNAMDVQITAQDGITVRTYSIVVDRRTSYGDWAFLQGVGNSGPAADFDSDGLPNLLEWAFGLNPTASARGTLVFSGSTLNIRGEPTMFFLPNGSGGTNYFALFCRRKDAVTVGLIYTVEFSADLSTWAASTATPNIVAVDSEIQAVTIQFPPSVNGQPTKFFRVRVANL